MRGVLRNPGPRRTTLISALYALSAIALVVAGILYGAAAAADAARAKAAEADDAYILVKEGAVTPLWGYQQLKMKDCAWCHRTVNLNRHHVVPQSANPALRDVKENLIVLCRDCHFVLGHRCNWKQYNPDVLYICTHFTNCVKSADTRYDITNVVDRLPQVPGYTNVYTNVSIDAERILHVTNDVPGDMQSALERILKSDAR